jgi:hypothetical protein
MPYMINGIGTTVLWASGDKKTGCYDCVEWFVVLYAPLIPIRCVHTFGWAGNAYRAVPLRWSWPLVARSFFGGWRWWLISVAVLLYFVTAILLYSGLTGGPRDAPMLVVALVLGFVATVLLAVGILAHVLLGASDLRNRRIRELLGRYELGHADPALLEEPLDVRPKKMFGARSFAEAVETLLNDNRLEDAMWAARLCVSLEDAAEGERLTDEVLAEAR